MEWINIKNYKFRGKCKNTDKYVYGNLLKIYNDYYIIQTATWNDYFINKQIFIFEDNSTDITYRCPLKIYKVDKDSIKQFIGYDKYNNEVYEDDILRM